MKQFRFIHKSLLLLGLLFAINLNHSAQNIEKQSTQAEISPSVVLYDNGSFNTGTFTTNRIPAPVGASLCELETSLGNITIGFGVNGAFRLADDFTVPIGQIWNVSSVTVYGYLTNSGATPSPFTSANIRIWNGPPNNPASTVIFGDTATNRLLTSVDTNIFRVTTANVNTQRRIWANKLLIDPILSLAPGTYWIDYGFNAGFAPPVKTLGQAGKTGANALQFDGSWTALVDIVPQDLPFLLNATVITSAGISAEGKVLDNFGNAIANALVTITGVQGITKSVRSNSFGAYRFENLSSGEMYIFNAAVKGRSFQPSVYTLTEDAHELNIYSD